MGGGGGGGGGDAIRVVNVQGVGWGRSLCLGFLSEN